MMKTTTFIVIILSFSCIANAQNKVNISQNGSGNSATVVQTNSNNTIDCPEIPPFAHHSNQNSILLWQGKNPSSKMKKTTDQSQKFDTNLENSGSVSARQQGHDNIISLLLLVSDSNESNEESDIKISQIGVHNRVQISGCSDKTESN